MIIMGCLPWLRPEPRWRSLERDASPDPLAGLGREGGGREQEGGDEGKGQGRGEEGWESDSGGVKDGK